MAPNMKFGFWAFKKWSESSILPSLNLSNWFQVVELPNPSLYIRFTKFDASDLNDCSTKDEALEIDATIYNVAQENLAKDICGKICSFTKYNHKLSLLAKNVLSKEIKEYGDGYFFIWSFYSSLYVEETVETFVFDFNTALISVGGSLGLFLGWSIKSMVLSLAEYINNFCYKYKSGSTNKVDELKPAIYKEPSEV